MEYPDFLQPTTFETIEVGNRNLKVPKCEVLFDKWMGEPVKETFGGKPLINYFGSAVFAELAIMQTFLKDGWETRWVETYGKKDPICLSGWKDAKYKEQLHVPFENAEITSLLSRIAMTNRSNYSGCWDVVAKKGGNLLFAESKRSKKDSLRDTQKDWLTSALQCGLDVDNFLLVEWNFQPLQA